MLYLLRCAVYRHIVLVFLTLDPSMYYSVCLFGSVSACLFFCLCLSFFLSLFYLQFFPMVFIKMVAHFAMRSYGLNQAFLFVEGIYLHRKSRPIQKKWEKTYFTTYVRNMFRATILYKYHGFSCLYVTFSSIFTFIFFV